MSDVTSLQGEDAGEVVPADEVVLVHARAIGALDPQGQPDWRRLYYDVAARLEVLERAAATSAHEEGVGAEAEGAELHVGVDSTDGESSGPLPSVTDSGEAEDSSKAEGQREGGSAHRQTLLSDEELIEVVWRWAKREGDSCDWDCPAKHGSYCLDGHAEAYNAREILRGRGYT